VAVAPAPRPPAASFALSPIVELEEDQRAPLFRRNAIYVIAGAVLFAVVYGLLSWLSTARSWTPASTSAT